MPPAPPPLDEAPPGWDDPEDHGAPFLALQLDSAAPPAPCHRVAPPAPLDSDVERARREGGALWDSMPFGTRGPLASAYAALQRATDGATARAALAMMRSAAGERGAA